MVSKLALLTLPLLSLANQHPALVVRQATTSRATASHTSSAAAGAGATGTANIVSNASTEPTPTLAALPTASPSGISNAPALPANGLSLSPSNYPALDITPPTNSPEVQEWLSQIDMSIVPNIPVNNKNGCANNTAAAGNATSSGTCWWTCGHCTRDTDVTFCPAKNDWGLSYDDGPGPYTPKLLDYLDTENIKTTFFIVGSRAISRPNMLQYEYLKGHQLAVHTWAHPEMTTLTNEQVVAELGWTKKVIKDITGVTPKYWRPPFGDVDDRVRNIALQMGLITVIWTTSGGVTYDTQDWQIPGGVVNLSTVETNFNNILNGANTIDTGFIVLEHDLYQQTVDLAIDVVLPQALALSNLKLKTIINCLGNSPGDAYLETGTNSSTFPTGSAAGASGVGDVPGIGNSIPAQATGGAVGGASNNGSGGSGSGSGGDSGAQSVKAFMGGFVGVAGVVAAGLTLL
ncbi:carbohydrate esterase family 4 protein [Atractiella rhizophila]|nr:carbohydrate esterase family 4 protein [Atractiella rhizophila]